MVELTYGGTWIKWDSLSKTDRNWALLSFITAFLSAAPIGLVVGDWAYDLGLRMGSGGQGTPRSGHDPIFSSDLFAQIMLAATVLAIVSAFAWWRFSRNQDEMFNRIQNYAIGMAGGWTLAFASVWWLMSLGRWVAPLPPVAIVLIGFSLLMVFWYRAVHRWL